MKRIIVIFLFSLIFVADIFAQLLAPQVTELKTWQFSKHMPYLWTTVSLPHSCNAIDGRSSSYYRGKTYYRYVLSLDEDQITRPLFLHFEMAGQASSVTVNGKPAISHRGGYTPFIVPLAGKVEVGENEIMVICDNTEDVQLAPVSSDFNKNNGLYGRVSLLEMKDVYASPVEYGQYRMHISTPVVNDAQATAKMTALLKNDGTASRKLKIRATLTDKGGSVCSVKKETVKIPAGQSFEYSAELIIKTPHLWNGLADPYLYTASIDVEDADGTPMDRVESKVGFRYFSVDPEKGFFLNGKSYSLRGVSVHQDWDGRATALTKEHFDIDYEIIRELGANFLRLAHYPHLDYAFQKCDELGIIVQTEIPWVNICGIRAEQSYFDNLHQQMKEMITNLFNHPSIVFWGMWNELDSWGNNDRFQGKLDPARVVSETALLYDYAKSLDPSRMVGMTDDSNFERPGYENLKGDYYSENRYCGWYFGKIEELIAHMRSNHEKMGIVTISEYGCGINPFCHSLEPLMTTQIGTGGVRHDEEFGNLYHEIQLSQILQMPFLLFTSSWVMFDFAVADRHEGYMDTEDGNIFTESEFRKFTNDKGFVTRDRKVKKDIFYLYKSLWNHSETTIHITSRRFTVRPANEKITIKVYSNAKELTLYRNGAKVQTMNGSGEDTGIIWCFDPIDFQTDKDTFRVISDNGVSDEVTFTTR